jgi:hypothetical protein
MLSVPRYSRSLTNLSPLSPKDLVVIGEGRFLRRGCLSEHILLRYGEHKHSEKRRTTISRKISLGNLIFQLGMMLLDPSDGVKV